MTAATQPASDALHPRSRPTARNKLALIDAAWVCHHLLALADLKQADKAVLCALIRHIDQLALDAGKTTVWPSTSCLALDTGYTERSVTRSISRLEARHLIKRFLPPRRRTYHTDLDGFCQLAEDALDAHAAVKAGRLPQARSGRLAIAVERETVSADPDIVSAPTETDIEPEISVQQSDAARGQFRRRPDKPAAANSASAADTRDRANRKAADCSPGGAGLLAGAGREPSFQAEWVRTALLAAWEASPTLRRLVDLDQLRSQPLQALNAIIARDYLATVTGIRNPRHIWSWAVNRHGVGNAILGWIIACDTPPTTERPERNPGGWYTRFATSEQPWDLSRNLRQLCRASPARPAPAVPADKSTERIAIRPEQCMPPKLEAGSATDILASYREAWIRTGAQRLGRGRAEAAWKSWLDEATVTGVDDDRLQVRVKTKFARDQIFRDYGDICRIAAEAIGYAGADFDAGPPPR